MGLERQALVLPCETVGDNHGLYHFGYTKSFREAPENLAGG